MARRMTVGSRLRQCGSARGLSASGSVPAFSPATLSPMLWLEASAAYLFQDADKLVPCADGTTVYTWADRSGSGYDFIQSTGAARPTANDPGGTLIPYFDLTHSMGAGDLSGDARLNSAAGITIIWRHSIEDATSTANRGSLSTYSLADGYDRFGGTNSFVHVARPTRLNSQPIVPLGKSTQTIRSSDSGYNRRLNGTQDITTTADFGGLDSWKIGLSGTAMLQGYLYGLLAFPSTLTNAQCLQVEAYLESLYP